MDDEQFKDLVIRKLEKIEDRHEKFEDKQSTKWDKLQDCMQDVREEQSKNSIILSQMQTDIPDIKKDLFEHKEGVIQNRSRIESLEAATVHQEEAITASLETHRLEVEPIIRHVADMQELPGKVKDFIINASKVMVAVVTILASSGSIIAYFMGWFGK